MKNLLIGAVLGAGLCFLLISATTYLLVLSGLLPARQDEAASDLERWMAGISLKATIKREAQRKSPLTADGQNLLAGAKLYAGYCSGCHGAPLNPMPSFATAYSPAAPLFLEDSPKNDDEKEIYWKIEHGIRFTGMPSFKKMLSEKEIWQLSLFLKNLEKLPPTVQAYWQTVK
ncbi:MAG: cytochrome c [Candidatus Obscuribacterales bacterium]|nr:cytochrome c [Candidatus Obscuribacterales bacterium]